MSGEPFMTEELVWLVSTILSYERRAGCCCCVLGAGWERIRSGASGERRPRSEEAVHTARRFFCQCECYGTRRHIVG